MDDRELLERAAKAAGIVVFPWPSEDPVRLNLMGGLEWNPLEDDGDALRLAHKLQLLVDNSLAGLGIVQVAGARDLHVREDGTSIAATRRAIVRAAASLHQPEGGMTE